MIQLQSWWQRWLRPGPPVLHAPPSAPVELPPERQKIIDAIRERQHIAINRAAALGLKMDVVERMDQRAQEALREVEERDGP